MPLALKAAAKTVLSEQDYKIFETLLALFGQDEKHRNKFAHWLWAYSDEAADHLILIDPIKPLRWQNAISHIIPGTKFICVIGDNREAAKWLQSASCYSRKQLERIVSDSSDTLTLIAAFWRLVGPPVYHTAPADEQRSNLLRQPRLAGRLHPQRSKTRSIPSEPHERPE